jgi:hypothetical protein
MEFIILTHRFHCILSIQCQFLSHPYFLSSDAIEYLKALSKKHPDEIPNPGHKYILG